MSEYIREEKLNTTIDINEKIKLYGTADITKFADIVIDFDASSITQKEIDVITNLPKILEDSGEVGVMEYGIFTFYINSLKTYEKDLILVK